MCIFEKKNVLSFAKIHFYKPPLPRPAVGPPEKHRQLVYLKMNLDKIIVFFWVDIDKIYIPCHAPPPRPAPPAPFEDPAPPLPLPRDAAGYFEFID